MPNWEYASLLNSGPATRDELNNLGSEGWELVSVVRADNAVSNSPQLLYVFKRQLAPAGA